MVDGGNNVSDWKLDIKNCVVISSDEIDDNGCGGRWMMDDIGDGRVELTMDDGRRCKGECRWSCSFSWY